MVYDINATYVILIWCKDGDKIQFIKYFVETIKLDTFTSSSV